MVQFPRMAAIKILRIIKRYRGHSGMACEACHGLALEGTVLSRAAADRTLFGDDNRTVSVPKGAQVSCTLCHENPLTGGGN